MASETVRPGVRETKKSTASAASRPQQVVAVTGTMPTSSKPAAPSTFRRRSGSESEAMATATAFSIACSCPSREASSPSALRSSPSGDGGCGQMNASRPPGRRACPILVNAAMWSAKNITPPRLIATS